MGVPYPAGSSAKPIKKVIDIKEIIGVKEVEKALLYAPDAIGEWLFKTYRDEFSLVTKYAPIDIEISSMTPSKTPVCYASMFTGMKPFEHGIEKPERRVLKVDTLFDTLERGGKKVAIVAIPGSSIDTLFKERKLDYYTEKYDEQVNRRAHEILRTHDYDVIVAYNQEYDDGIHSTTPTSEVSLKGFRNHLKAFAELARVFNESYGDKNRVIAFIPDHGIHLDPETGKGAHGSEKPEDMDVRHFWGIYKGD
jgi:hypothetical protein